MHFAFKFKDNNSCIISLENFTNNVILTLVVLKYYIVASLNSFYGLGAIGKYYIQRTGLKPKVAKHIVDIRIFIGKIFLLVKIRRIQ